MKNEDSEDVVNTDVSELERVNSKAVVGKTIARVGQHCINTLVFEFTDGSKLELETEHAGNGIYTIVESR